MKSVFIVGVLATLAGTVAAGRDEVEAATGAGFALVVVEKCTGVAPSPDYIPRLRTGMIRTGMSDEDFRKGLLIGTMRAEGMFRGKPPSNECKEAKAMKAVIDRTFL